MIITEHGNNPVFPLSLSGPEPFTTQTIEARCYYHNNRPLINFATHLQHASLPFIRWIMIRVNYSLKEMHFI